MSELRAVTLSHIMTHSEQKLRKANKELKDEVAELKVKLEKVLKGLSERTEECKLNVGNGGEVLSPDKTKSVEFVSNQYDDLIAFEVRASKELEEIREDIWDLRPHPEITRCFWTVQLPIQNLEWDTSNS